MPDFAPAYDFIGPAVQSLEEFIYRDVNGALLGLGRCGHRLLGHSVSSVFLSAKPTQFLAATALALLTATLTFKQH